MDEALELLLKKGQDLHEYVSKANQPEYLYWDKVRYKHPADVSPMEFWAMVKVLRLYSPSRSRTVVRDEKGNYFSWQPLPGLDNFLYLVDRSLGGALEPLLQVDTDVSKRYKIRSKIEEAIASSQLEGATTTRSVAKRMLLEKRPADDKSMQMIRNNYQAILLIDNELGRQRFSLEGLLELHRLLTVDTINSSEVGRLRTDADCVQVVDVHSDVTYHIPPSASFLMKEINRLLEYANDSLVPGQDEHPVIKAIILHFWIGYLHPFTDGNGRMARALFYGYLRRRNYSALDFIQLSRAFKNSPGQYRMAYVYSEQDDNDLTYFIDYNVRQIVKLRREFLLHFQKREYENQKMVAGVLRAGLSLNDRQIQLLRYLNKTPEATTTVRTHSEVNEISRPTAQKDLERLVSLGFLTSEKQGRERPFRATEKVAELFG